MSTTKKNEKDNVSENELPEQTSPLNEEMSDTELDGIAAAGTWSKGTSGDDFMFGGDGDDKMRGGGGEDTLIGGAGDDSMDGGYKDGADDMIVGGAGDDVFYWGPTMDGNDTFIGGEGNDRVELDLKTLSENNIQDAYNNGSIDISLFDASGNPVEITDGMWENGVLQLPGGMSGTITGPEGDVLTFSGVESIETL